MILAIDTSTRQAGLALVDDGEVLAEEIWHSANNHTVELTPRIKRMMDNAGIKVRELQAIAVALGPGSFTGLRIGLAAAKGLALPHKIPLIGVPTLDILVEPLMPVGKPVWTVLEAGRGRYGVALYDSAQESQELPSPFLATLGGLIKSIVTPSLVVGELTKSARQELLEQAADRISLLPCTDNIRRPSILAEIARKKLKESAGAAFAPLEPIYLRHESIDA